MPRLVQVTAAVDEVTTAVDAMLSQIETDFAFATALQNADDDYKPEVEADAAAWWLCVHDEVKRKAVEVTAGTGVQANGPIISPKPATFSRYELWPNEATGFVFDANYYDTLPRKTVKCVREAQRSTRSLGGPDQHLLRQPDSLEIISGVNPVSAHYYQSKGRWCIKALMYWSPSFFLRSALAEWRSHAQQMAYQKIDLPGWYMARFNMDILPGHGRQCWPFGRPMCFLGLVFLSDKCFLWYVLTSWKDEAVYLRFSRVLADEPKPKKAKTGAKSEDQVTAEE